MTDTKLDLRQDEKPLPPAATSSRRHPLALLRQEIDRVFDDMAWPSLGGMRSRGSFDSFRDLLAGFGSGPAVDLVERESQLEIKADLPGMEAEKIEVNLTDGFLTIRGEKSDTREESEKGFHLHERSSGSFSRSFALPAGIDPDRVEASFRNGVLTIIIPRSPTTPSKSRKIEVRPT